LEAGFAEPLDVGLAFADVAFAVFVVDLALVFVAAAFAAVFLASLFALVAFLVDGFFTVAAFLVVEVAFLGAAPGFFVVADLSAGVLVFEVAAFLVAFTEDAFLDGGFAFSLVSAETLGRLGASLTLPEGPLGKTNVSFSAPRVSAKLS